MKPTNKVTFRVFPEGDVIALFPNEITDPHGNIMSYMHMGQHGAASPKLCYELRYAKKAEYESLLNELIAVGYDDLEVIE